VQDVAFHKKCDIAVAEMVKSPWVYRRPRNFRAAIEAGTSCLKPLRRCTLHPGPRRGRLWRGLDHLKAYIWSAVVAHNLMLFSCLRPTYLRLLAPVTGAGPVRPDHSCTKANPLLPVSTAT